MNIYHHKFLIFKHSRPSSCDSVVLRRQIVLDDDFFAAAVNTTSDQSAPGTNSLELIPPLRFTSVCICDSGHVRVTFQSSWPTVDPRRGSAFLPQSISDDFFSSFNSGELIVATGCGRAWRPKKSHSQNFIRSIMIPYLPPGLCSLWGAVPRGEFGHLIAFKLNIDMNNEGKSLLNDFLNTFQNLYLKKIQNKSDLWSFF